MVDSFLKYLSYEKRYSDHTIKSYKTDLKQFSDFLELNYPYITNLNESSHREIRAWIVSLVDADIEPRSINRKIASLRAYFKFLLKRDEIEKDPTWKIRVLKISKKLPHFVRENDMVKMLDNFDFENDFSGTRDKLVLELLYGTGIRLSELLNLTKDDIDLNSETIKVLGKRKKQRIIPFPKSLKELIVKYKSLKTKKFENNKNPILIVTDNGKDCYPMFIYRTVKKYLEAITGVDKKSPHVLRHTFATHLLNKGAELNAVKELLGHSSLAATQVYTHNSIEKLKRVFDQAHPKA